ncbi:MAG: two-component system sensor histidine kinase UhpB [Gammaproteobacteria bacterium]|jgi:two-component system sensor histidine kinase UhpB
MSLRVRLNILITLLFAVVLIGAGTYVISNARRAVSEEIESSARHTLQLIEVLLESVDLSGQIALQELVLESLSKLESSRHLQISVLREENRGGQTQVRQRAILVTAAPQWFIRLVHSKPMEFRRIIAEPGKPDIEIIIHADPSDEITEAWYETRSVLFFLLLFIALANVLLYFALGRYLAPIESIMAGLERIEQGDYHLRLPQYELPELTRISGKFNHMADVLLKSREENRELTQKALAIQEHERRHLAQELHDELGQSLSAIKAVAVSIEQKSVGMDSSISKNAKAIVSFSERMYEVARNMMQRLRPSVLDELGLLVALQDMIDDWNERHGEIFCHFNCPDDLRELGEDININLYRIIQESLTNVIKHAHADEVHVSIRRASNQLTVNISDDGIGYESSLMQRGLGLLGMQERVEALSGVFELSSEFEQGVSIRIVIPLARTNESMEN